METVMTLFRKIDLSGWSSFEKKLVATIITMIMASTFYFSFTTPSDNMMAWVMNWIVSPLASITGIICVVLVAKENITNYYWGFVNAIMYGAVAWVSGYYGDWILNWFFFLPFQFIGWYMWKKYHMNPLSKIYINPKIMSKTGVAITTIISILALIGFGIFLSGVDSWFVTVMKRNASIYESITKVTGFALLGPILDSSTEVLQIIGQILMVMAFSQQWLFWILTNIITIFMWVIVVIEDPSSISWVTPIVIMWVGFLINSFYGYYKWTKDAKEVK